MKKKKESQKKLKAQYQALERYAAMINNPSNTHRKYRGKNGQYNRSNVNHVSIRTELEPLN